MRQILILGSRGSSVCPGPLVPCDSALGLLRKGLVLQLIQSYQRMPGNAMVRGFRVAYKRHVLTMDDLGTLYGQNWLNDQVRRGGGTGLKGDLGRRVSGALCLGEPCEHAAPLVASCIPSSPQVMNMYGDLVMDTVPEKVGLPRALGSPGGVLRCQAAGLAPWVPSALHEERVCFGGGGGGHSGKPRPVPSARSAVVVPVADPTGGGWAAGRELGFCLNEPDWTLLKLAPGAIGTRRGRAEGTRRAGPGSANSGSAVSSAQVHFFNSFFYDKLRTRGYDGVKRWTKNVSCPFTAARGTPLPVQQWSLLPKPAHSGPHRLGVCCVCGAVVGTEDSVGRNTCCPCAV